MARFIGHQRRFREADAAGLLPRRSSLFTFCRVPPPGSGGPLGISAGLYDGKPRDGMMASSAIPARIRNEALSARSRAAVLISTASATCSGVADVPLKLSVN